MKLSIERLTAEPSVHHYQADAIWWDTWTGAPEDDPEVVTDWPRFRVDARLAGEDVRLAGEVEAALEVECSRCLKRYRQAVQDSFEMLLEPIRGRQPPDPEGVEMLEKFGVYLGDELEVGWYRGKEIELDPLLAEVTALAMPFQPLCREDCAGLCPHCGIDRNQASCDCTDQKPDSPFAALAALRKDLDGSS